MSSYGCALRFAARDATASRYGSLSLTRKAAAQSRSAKPQREASTALQLPS